MQNTRIRIHSSCSFGGCFDCAKGLVVADSRLLGNTYIAISLLAWVRSILLKPEVHRVIPRRISQITIWSILGIEGECKTEN